VKAWPFFMPVFHTKRRKTGGVGFIFILFFINTPKKPTKPLKAHYFWGVFSLKAYYYVELLQLALLS
jgi:hypothetical protein